VSRHSDHESGWPNCLPFEPMALPDTVGLTAEILGAVARAEPELDIDAQLERARRVAISLGFLAGAVDARFVGHVDAYVHVGKYGVHVIL
jgi:hypothetical protein